ncbi:MAG TPA: AlpA family phage regulatory protein [Cellvibrio sp.]|nr:AlpA family phage regulatory protein [Cellvibrio sp.]
MTTTSIAPKSEAINSLAVDPLIRLPQVLQILPIGKSTFWKMIADGRAPRGRKLGEKTTVWKLSEIKKMVDDLDKEEV